MLPKIKKDNDDTKPSPDLNNHKDANDMGKTIVFVNGEKYGLDSNQVKIGSLIEMGGGNTSDYELQERKDESGPIAHIYNDPNKIITVKNETHFITHFTAPVNPA